MDKELQELGTNRQKAIKRKCMDCACGLPEIKACSVLSCPLWYYRLGNPFSQKYKDNILLIKANFRGRERMSANEIIKAIKNASEGTPASTFPKDIVQAIVDPAEKEIIAQNKASTKQN